MAFLPIHDYFLFDQKLVPTKAYQPAMNSGGIYEVVRVMRGVPLFFEDHIKRFFNSSRLAKLPVLLSENEIRDALLRVIKENNVPDGNLLIALHTHFIVHFIPHKYPDKLLYDSGIKTGVILAERPSPNAKILVPDIRAKANEMILNQNVYEVLLVDHEQRIMEGSRSNVFFVKNNQLITPPTEEVLPGITRAKTILLAQKQNMMVLEKDVYLNHLKHFDAVFITGTSPKILPVTQIESRYFDPLNKLVKHLMESYDQLVEKYVSAQQSLMGR
ncbi:MAG: hypothetical protein CR996_00660 [Draconibacterium sp.]|nr:MAG: hypothetical protein CR996_00660 [Draconibacterium sp.]PIF05221.1 MAG: hypothetical protein CSA36_07800 [Draconibacterium sp.]